MEFEFDERKSRSNGRKHGIDFHEAQRLWDGPTVTLRSSNPSEERLLLMGMVEDRHYTAIITLRGVDRERIRIISVRRSRDEEKEILKAK